MTGCNYFKITLMLCCLHCFCIANPAASGDEEINDLPTYLKKFEKFDLEKVFRNKQILDHFLKCFVNEGPCNQEAEDFKRVIPVLAKTMCQGCEDKDILSIKKAFIYVRSKKPEIWEKIVKIHDPSGVNLNKFLD